MKFEEALNEAREVESKYHKLLKEKNEQWKVPDDDLGDLKGAEFEEGIERSYKGLIAFSYLEWLVEDGGVEDISREDIAELEAVPGFKDHSFQLQK